MKELLIEEEELNRQGGSVWIGRGGGSSAVPFPFEASETILQIDR